MQPLPDQDTLLLVCPAPCDSLLSPPSELPWLYFVRSLVLITHFSAFTGVEGHSVCSMLASSLVSVAQVSGSQLCGVAGVVV